MQIKDKINVQQWSIQTCWLSISISKIATVRRSYKVLTFCCITFKIKALQCKVSEFNVSP